MESTTYWTTFKYKVAKVIHITYQKGWIWIGYSGSDQAIMFRTRPFPDSQIHSTEENVAGLRRQINIIEFLGYLTTCEKQMTVS